MAKLVAAVLVVASFLLVAPVIESASTSTQLFVAIGNADGSGGGE